MSNIFGFALLPSWKDSLLPASYNGCLFHVDVNAKHSGRREIEHEFAKRDLPYAEDMGRRGYRFTITGYLIGDTYIDDMQALMAALETEGNGTLVHPTLGPLQVQPGPYTVTERRERGRMCEFEMNFIEAGAIQSFSPTASTQATVATAAAGAGAAASTSVDLALKSASPAASGVGHN